jgi:ribosomal protein S18 acetylase RimI-like enzyme
MVSIKVLERFTIDDQRNLGKNGYTSMGKYVVTKKESIGSTTIALELVELEIPYVKTWPHVEADFERYLQILPLKHSFGAYDYERLVGVLIAEPSAWNNTLLIDNIAVSETYRKRGIGSRLMKRVELLAIQKGYRVIALETQNTNLPAIDFYRKNGFEIDGVDLSYYTNADLAEGEVAIFMKKKLTQPGGQRR